VSLSFDSLLYDNDDTTTLPPARTWYKDNVDASDKHREPEDSIANWTIKLGKSTYKVHKGILGQGVHKSGYFNHIFLRWTQGTNDITDLTLSLHTHCHHAWEAVLDFVYMDSIIVAASPDDWTKHLFKTASTVVSTFKIAHFLLMPSLMRICVNHMKNNLTHETAYPMLRKALVLSPGLDAIIHNCISNLALEFNQCDAKSFVGLPLETISTILSRANTDEFKAKPLKISNAIAACLRDLDSDNASQEQYFHGLTGSLSRVAAEDAIFLFAKSIEYKHDGVRQLSLLTVTGCFCQKKIWENIALIQDHQAVCELLGRDELNAPEDCVFQAIKLYCETKGDALSSEERTEIWKTCRFVHLNNKETILDLINVNDLPPLFVKLALVGSLIHSKFGQENFDALALAGTVLKKRTGNLARDLSDGTSCLCRWKSMTGKYYKCTIRSRNKDGTFIIDYEDGDEDTIVEMERLCFEPSHKT